MKRILVAPLDWGLGHATRCIPVIRKLIDRQAEVILAGSGQSLQLLQQEFPKLSSFELPGYSPRYPSSGSMVWKMTAQLPRFLMVIRKEHDVLEKIITEQKIDLVISDNRYGCWTNKVPCVFITHQSNILMPKRFGWLAPVVRWLNYRMMNNFTRCWIPDYPGEQSLAGDLISFGSILGKDRIRYIGLLSRFTPSGKHMKKYDLLCIFSGPEPQRTLLEQLILKQLSDFTGKVLVVRGVLNPVQPIQTEADVVDFMTSGDLQEAIESSELVLARSGFSTLMDLSKLSSRAILIPTPGQTEQEYLAAKLRASGVAYSAPQHTFDLMQAVSAAAAFNGFTWNGKDDRYLEKAIDEALTL